MNLVDAFKEEILKLDSAMMVLSDLAAHAMPVGDTAEFLVTERPLAIHDAKEAIETLRALAALLEAQIELDRIPVPKSILRLAAND